MRILIILILISLFSCHTKTTAKKEKPTIYQANWESLKQHKTPNWFLDAKFGIYCYWGPYSVPEFENEWYSHWMYVDKNNPEANNKTGQKINKHHIKTYRLLDNFDYKDFYSLSKFALKLKIFIKIFNY